MSRRLPDILTENEFKRLIDNTYKNHHKAAFIIAFKCGLRISEVINLQPDNIDRGRQAIKVVNGKGSKDRYVYYGKGLTPWLKYVPIGISKRAVQHALKLAIKRANIKKSIHFHSLRHSYASILLQKGANLKHVQQLLGHSNISTTNQYLHISDEDLKKKVIELW